MSIAAITMWRVVVAAVVVACGSAAVMAEGPCDIYAAGGTPCVGAYSVTRALFGSYNGPLYQVQRASDNATTDIALLVAGGVVNAALQDAFCAGTACTVQRIYDQSSHRNHLGTAPPGTAGRQHDIGTNASHTRVTLAGKPAYAAVFEGGMGYRNDTTTGVAVGDEPESIYMVVSGTHYNDKCCFDLGNAEVDSRDDGRGAMEAVYWGSSTTTGRGGGDGPWVMADLEKGLWAGNTKVYSENKPIKADFVTAMAKGRAGGFALKGGNAQEGKLTSLFDGPRPRDYDPMKKQGAIILGIGGDNSNWAVGTFFEGVITSGFASNATDDAVQANIVAAGYGK
eukprot:m.153614 g.153614  ORF g.153614 m.153614 type:complete len:339 (-) comp17477_c0_seq1:287-1303(-)